MSTLICLSSISICNLLIDLPSYFNRPPTPSTRCEVNHNEWRCVFTLQSAYYYVIVVVAVDLKNLRPETKVDGLVSGLMV
jgi:hypothetical protein